MFSRVVLITISTALLMCAGYLVSDFLAKERSSTVQAILQPYLKNPLLPAFQEKTEFVAQKYGGADPHGDDPHGDDPRDEVHDPKLPANQAKSNAKAPRDVYGGAVPNSQQPY
jgi:hypothetical protein